MLFKSKNLFLQEQVKLYNLNKNKTSIQLISI